MFGMDRNLRRGGTAMKKKKRRGKRFLTVLAVLLLLIAALAVAFYLYQHEGDWLSSSQALRIAAHDAGTDEGRVYDVSTTYGTTETGLPVYEILFTDHTAEYRYVVDAQTGHILDRMTKPTDPES